MSPCRQCLGLYAEHFRCGRCRHEPVFPLKFFEQSAKLVHVANLLSMATRAGARSLVSQVSEWVLAESLSTQPGGRACYAPSSWRLVLSLYRLPCAALDVALWSAVSCACLKARIDTGIVVSARRPYNILVNTGPTE